MGESEAFLDRGEEFLKRLQTPESDKKPGNSMSINTWATLKATAKVYVLFSRPPTTRWGPEQIRFGPNLLPQYSLGGKL